MNDFLLPFINNGDSNKASKNKGKYNFRFLGKLLVSKTAWSYVKIDNDHLKSHFYSNVVSNIIVI